MDRTKAIFFVLAIVAVVIGCSGGDKEQNGSTSSNARLSSLPANKLLSSLTEAEAKQLFDEASAYCSEQTHKILSEERVCSAMPIASASSELLSESIDRCVSSTNGCIASGRAESTELIQPDRLVYASLPLCNATVGEYEACSKDRADTYIELINRWPRCQELTASYIELIQSQLKQVDPPSCKIYSDKCP